MADADLSMKDILGYISLAIRFDYLICILITSASEGRQASLGIDYGVGKSTLMLYIMYVFVDKFGKCQTEQEKWDRIFSMLYAFPWELEQFYYTAPTRCPGEPIFIAVDDLQRSFGKDRSKDNYIRSLANRLTTARQQAPVFIASAPDIGEIAYPFRFKFNFEIKVPKRGEYEVQRLKKWTDFQNPYVTRVTMPKTDWKPGVFPKLSDLNKEAEDRYKAWRTEANRRYDEGEGEWRLRSIRNVLTDEAKQLLETIIAKGSYDRAHITRELDQGGELKLLQNCGLVEKFGDTIVPTKQARKMVKLI